MRLAYVEHENKRPKWRSVLAEAIETQSSWNITQHPQKVLECFWIRNRPTNCYILKYINTCNFVGLRFSGLRTYVYNINQEVFCKIKGVCLSVLCISVTCHVLAFHPQYAQLSRHTGTNVWVLMQQWVCSICMFSSVSTGGLLRPKDLHLLQKFGVCVCG